MHASSKFLPLHLKTVASYTGYSDQENMALPAKKAYPVHSTSLQVLCQTLLVETTAGTAQ